MTSHHSQTDIWLPPLPITGALRHVPAFDPNLLLPESLRAWVCDESERMSCPPDFVAAAAVVALASLVGARCAMKPKALDGWQVVPNLWGAIVANPAAKKTPSMKAGFAPLHRVISQVTKEYQQTLEHHTLREAIHAAQILAADNRIKNAARSKDTETELEAFVKERHALQCQAPAKPTCRRYMTNDSTVEKLGELLRDNEQGLLVYRDELAGLLASWEKDGREGDRSFFLEGWNGDQSFDTDRIGRGNIHIPNVCLSVFGGIQPDKLTMYLEQTARSLGNDGMLQRFQVLIYADHARWQLCDREPNKAAREAAFSIFETVARFSPEEWGATPPGEFERFQHFSFDEAAQEIFVEWHTELHSKRLPDEPDPIMQQHLSKYDKLFSSLALVFHLVDCATSGEGGPVGIEAAMRARAWCNYLEPHARRCYGLLKDDGLRAAQALAERIQRGSLENGFTVRDVRRNQWRYLTTDGAIEAALDWLEDNHWVRAEERGGLGPGSGRRTTGHAINPDICKQSPRLSDSRIANDAPPTANTAERDSNGSNGSGPPYAQHTPLCT